MLAIAAPVDSGTSEPVPLLDALRDALALLPAPVEREAVPLAVPLVVPDDDVEAPVPVGAVELTPGTIGDASDVGTMGVAVAVAMVETVARLLA